MNEERREDHEQRQSRGCWERSSRGGRGVPAVRVEYARHPVCGSLTERAGAPAEAFGEDVCWG